MVKYKQMSKYPTLSKAPLVDTVVELRFNTHTPSQVMGGLLYSKLQDYGYSVFQELPIMQLPENIRENDPGLKYSINFRIKKDNFWIGVGKSVLTISTICKDGSYVGWDLYKKEIEVVFSVFDELFSINSFERVGVRYINIFTRENILNDINLQLTTPWTENLSEEFSVGFVRTDEDVRSRIQVVYPATMNFETDSTSKTGQLLDIDSYVEGSIPSDAALDTIGILHDKTEQSFFETLKPDFIEELK